MGRKRSRLTEDEKRFLQELGIEHGGLDKYENVNKTINEIYDSAQLNKKLVDEVVVSTKPVLIDKRDKTEEMTMDIELIV